MLSIHDIANNLVASAIWLIAGFIAVTLWRRLRKQFEDSQKEASDFRALVTRLTARDENSAFFLGTSLLLGKKRDGLEDAKHALVMIWVGFLGIGLYARAHPADSDAGTITLAALVLLLVCYSLYFRYRSVYNRFEKSFHDGLNAYVAAQKKSE